VQTVSAALQKGPLTLEELKQASGLSLIRTMLGAAKMIRGDFLSKHT
jgi:hypothetical protein